MASDVIRSRADFFRVLDEALKGILDRLTKVPNLGAYQIIENELDAMKRWTANGRTPTQDERDRVDIGVITIRELEPAGTDEDQEDPPL
jgi:hypothetical protein